MLRLLISNPSFLHIHTHLVKSNSLISFPIVVPRHDKLRRGWGRRGNKNENSCYATRSGKIGARIPFSFWDSGGRWLANDNAIWFHPFADFPPSPSPLYPLSAARGRKIWPALHGGEEGREGNGTLLSGNLYRIQPCDRYVESFFSEGRGQAGRAIAFYYGP